MKNYCGKCGSKLNPKTGICPKCNKKIQNKKRFKSCVLIVALLLLLYGLIGAYVYVKKNMNIKLFDKSSNEYYIKDESKKELEEDILESEELREIYLITMTKSKPEGGGFYWVEYEYDNNGRTIKSINYNENGEKLSWTEYENNKEGKCIEQTRYDKNEEITNITKAEYDNNGYRKKYTNYNAHGTVTGYAELDYDDDGHMLEQFYYDASGRCLSSEKYEYDEFGNQIKKEEYNAVDGPEGVEVEGQFSVEEYKYDENNQLVKSVQYNESGTIRESIVYERDEEGRILQEIKYGWDENEIIEWEEYIYSKENENITSIYKYDSQGNLLGYEVEDVEKKEGLNTTKICTTTKRYYADGSVDCSWWEEIEYVKMKVK